MRSKRKSLQGSSGPPKRYRDNLLKEIGAVKHIIKDWQPDDLTGKEAANALGLSIQCVRLFPYHVLPFTRFRSGTLGQYFRLEQFTPEIVASIRTCAQGVRGCSGDVWRFEGLQAYLDKHGNPVPCNYVVFKPGRWDVTVYPSGVIVNGRAKLFRLVDVDGCIIDLKPYLVGMLQANDNTTQPI